MVWWLITDVPAVEIPGLPRGEVNCAQIVFLQLSSKGTVAYFPKPLECGCMTSSFRGCPMSFSGLFARPQCELWGLR